MRKLTIATLINLIVAGFASNLLCSKFSMLEFNATILWYIFGAIVLLVCVIILLVIKHYFAVKMREKIALSKYKPLNYIKIRDKRGLIKSESKL